MLSQVSESRPGAPRVVVGMRGIVHAYVDFLLVIVLRRHDFDALPGGFAFRPYDNLHGPSQAHKTIHHLHLADAAKLAAQHPGKLGLSQAQFLRCLLLAPSPIAKNLSDLRHKLRLHLHLVGVGKAELRVDVCFFIQAAQPFAPFANTGRSARKIRTAANAEMA